MSERELVRACQRGERQAFEELIRMFYPYVLKFLLKMTRDRQSAEDLTQETFLKMIRGVERFSPEGRAGFGTWLVAIAKNCYIDFLRRNGTPLLDIDKVSLPDGDDALDRMAERLRYEDVLKAIDALPREQGLAIRLKYEERMTLAEIAAYFDVPEKTIKSRIHEGTEKLRRLFRPAADSEGRDGWS